ncbi:hypothetical protein Cgig2_027208 [Carnegiea gigantea]|uniref:CCHC-type domain-containing protein n=1 Tax=Carnegiea gigantea TaxID=171969 RepID=A0A9Q1GHV3_9CARY|nr:hypothetical protein Cgig2_027208 [Carnegiea gigantea]
MFDLNELPNNEAMMGLFEQDMLDIDVAVQEIKQRNLHDDMLAIQKINVLKVKSPLENKLLSCKKFEFFEILCRHILRIFLQKDSHKIPSAYLPSRWCLQQYSHELDVLEGKILIDNDPLMAGNDILCTPKSTTKGRPRKKRMKGGKESAKHSRHCSKCKKPGHYANCCPQDKENAIVLDDAPNKKKKAVANDLDLNPIFCVKY